MRTIIFAGVSAVALSFMGSTGALACTGSQCFEQVVTPPLYATQNHTVMVAPSRVISHVRPAEYGTVEQPVVVRPEQRVGHWVAGEVQRVPETVMIAPASRRWQVTTDAFGRTVGCWVEVPAQYVTHYRKVVTRLPHVVEERIPAVIGVQQRTVMVRPPVVHQKVIPAEYGTVSRTVQVAPGHVGWRPMY